MPGMYLSAAAREKIRAAQACLDLHVLGAGDERCQRCGTEGPCPIRRAALRLLGRYGVLPVRRPGATRPELAAGPESREPGAGWFTASDPEPATEPSETEPGSEPDLTAR